MYEGDHTKTAGTVTVVDDGSEIWRANEAATVNVVFPSGTWGVNITLNEAFANNEEFTVEIGSHAGGTSFIAVGGGTHTFTGDGSTTNFSTSIASVESFTVNTGDYLALRITNPEAGTADLVVNTGLNNSYLTSPETDPGYPIPELPTIILLGTGLACLGGYVAFMRRKKRVS